MIRIELGSDCSLLIFVSKLLFNNIHSYLTIVLDVVK